MLCSKFNFMWKWPDPGTSKKCCKLCKARNEASNCETDNWVHFYNAIWSYLSHHTISNSLQTLCSFWISIALFCMYLARYRAPDSISTILKTVLVQMGAGTGHIGWRYHLTPTKSFREYSKIHTRCEAPSPSAKRERGYSETLLASGTSAAP